MTPAIISESGHGYGVGCEEPRSKVSPRCWCFYSLESGGIQVTGADVINSRGMKDRSGYITGQLADWPTKERMAEVLRAAGLRVVIGRYSIRVDDCSHFVFQEYGGDLGEPQIEADADSGAAMVREAAIVSSALASAGIRHCFEIYDHSPQMVVYLHYDWPLDTA